jgi:hypothetical protein
MHIREVHEPRFRLIGAQAEAAEPEPVHNFLPVSRS